MSKVGVAPLVNVFFSFPARDSGTLGGGSWDAHHHVGKAHLLALMKVIFHDHGSGSPS